MRIGVCDISKEDIERTRDLILSVASKYVDIQIRTYTPEEAMIDLEDERFDCDVLFAEVDYPQHDYNGVDLGKVVNRKTPVCQIVYMSTDSKFVSEIYDVKHCYYIQKERIEEYMPLAYQKVISQYEYETRNNFLKITSNSHTVNIPFSEIAYIEKVGRKTKIVTSFREYLCYQSLNVTIGMLTDDFKRCHGSFIVNTSKILFKGTDMLELKGGYKIPVSKTFVADI